MRNKKLIITSLFIFALLFLNSCKKSTDELTELVKTSMQETWSDSETQIQIESLSLIHKDGNEYSGILETTEDGEKKTHSVQVIYDGETFQWEIDK